MTEQSERHWLTYLTPTERHLYECAKKGLQLRPPVPSEQRLLVVASNLCRLGCRRQKQMHVAVQQMAFPS